MPIRQIVARVSEINLPFPASTNPLLPATWSAPTPTPIPQTGKAAPQFAWANHCHFASSAHPALSPSVWEPKVVPNPPIAAKSYPERTLALDVPFPIGKHPGFSPAVWSRLEIPPARRIPWAILRTEDAIIPVSTINPALWTEIQNPPRRSLSRWIRAMVDEPTRYAANPSLAWIPWLHERPEKPWITGPRYSRPVVLDQPYIASILVALTLRYLDSSVIHRRDLFAGNGSTTVLAVTKEPIAANSEILYLSGHGFLEKDVHYTINSEGTAATLTFAPTAGETVGFYYQQEFTNSERIIPSVWPDNRSTRQGHAHRRQMFTGDGTTADFLLSSPMLDDSEVLYSALSGFYEPGIHYSVISSQTIRFVIPPRSGEKIGVYYLESDF